MFRIFLFKQSFANPTRFMGLVLFLWTVQCGAADAVVHGLCTASNYKVVFFRPDAKRNNFWMQADKFAYAVAEDLSISLEIVTINDSNEQWNSFDNQIEAILKRQDPPDAIVSVLYGAREYAQIAQFDKYNIPLFTINVSLEEKVLKLTSQPRSLFQNWLGHMSPDEVSAGAQLVQILHESRAGNRIAFVSGSSSSRVNAHRLKGAMQKAEQLGLDIIPAIYTDWSSTNAEQAATTLLRRVAEVDILWTAGPDIAVGVDRIFSKQSAHTKSGSFDWAPVNIEMLESGRLQASLGGHFMEAGWALVLLFDYLSGMDFKDDRGLLMHSNLEVMNADNAQQVLQILSAEYLREINFRGYSRCLNPGQKSYDFKFPLPQSEAQLN